MQHANEHGFYDANKAELDYIYLKKGYLLGLLTYIYNENKPQQMVINKLYEELLIRLPDFKNNLYYRSDRKLHLLHLFITRYTMLSFKVLPWYIRKTKIKL